MYRPTEALSVLWFEWFSSVRFGSVRFGSVRFGSNFFDLGSVQFGSLPSDGGSVRFGSNFKRSGSNSNRTVVRMCFGLSPNKRQTHTPPNIYTHTNAKHTRARNMALCLLCLCPCVILGLVHVIILNMSNIKPPGFRIA
jgi:hypothetical protein